MLFGPRLNSTRNTFVCVKQIARYILQYNQHTTCARPKTGKRESQFSIDVSMMCATMLASTVLIYVKIPSSINSQMALIRTVLWGACRLFKSVCIRNKKKEEESHNNCNTASFSILKIECAWWRGFLLGSNDVHTNALDGKMIFLSLLSMLFFHPIVVVVVTHKYICFYIVVVVVVATIECVSRPRSFVCSIALCFEWHYQWISGGLTRLVNQQAIDDNDEKLFEVFFDCCYTTQSVSSPRAFAVRIFFMLLLFALVTFGLLHT